MQAMHLLYTVLAVQLLRVTAAPASGWTNNECQFIPPLASYPPAQSFCSRNYPLPEQTVTVTAKYQRDVRRNLVPVIKHDNTYPLLWTEYQKSGTAFHSTLCSCIETKRTKTITVMATTTATTTTPYPSSEAVSSQSISKTTSNSTPRTALSTNAPSTQTMPVITTTSETTAPVSNPPQTTLLATTMSVVTTPAVVTISETTTSEFATLVTITPDVTSTSETTMLTTTTTAAEVPLPPPATCSLNGLQPFLLQTVDSTGSIDFLSAMDRGGFFMIQRGTIAQAAIFYQRGSSLGYCSGADTYIGDIDGNPQSQSFLDPDGNAFGPLIAVVVDDQDNTNVLLTSDSRNLNYYCGNWFHIGTEVATSCTDVVTITKVFL